MKFNKHIQILINCTEYKNTHTSSKSVKPISNLNSSEWIYSYSAYFTESDAYLLQKFVYFYR